MKYLPFIFPVAILSCLLVLSGCEMLEVQTAADGTQHTQLTDIIGNVSSVSNSVGLVFPAAAAVGGILSLVANGLLGYAARRKTVQANKLTAALESVVAGVNAFSSNYDELRDRLKDSAIKLGKPEYADDINVIFENGKSVKDIISGIANDRNIESFLKLFVKTAEATGKAG
ncbi:hypothetical protein KsCSTR_18480 [Candidatus Kuenenia stuttgartiensis]|uniref:Uncharacterized protein n=1 Tax=Kuenenia stuttgartiensis TaxID=174633 RepID=A0A6G7GPV7_KUEST|nr:hypothetical protein [Candidatus Kuenenia stuttgartiensis]QII11227.1 hypothetical protein KsCSTR_18480 [Candidatus Kuenenia stuttgartiensis]